MSDIELIINEAIDNLEIEIRRGAIVLLVLAVLVKEDIHGKALVDIIAAETAGMIEVPLGTIYPLLRRFKKDGMIETYGAKDDARKTMYRLNRHGNKFFIRAREIWLRYSAATSRFIDNVDEQQLGVI